MQYDYNANVSLVENSQEAKTAWQCSHGDLINKFHGVFIRGHHWIIVVHSQNLGNNINSSPGREIYTDTPVDLKELANFGIDVDNLKEKYDE